MKKGKKRYFFTLLEIMICLCILGAASWFYIGTLKNMLAMHKYQTSMSLLTDKIRVLQTFALVYQTDIEVHLFSDAQGVWYETSCEEPNVLAGQTRHLLPEVRSVEVNGRMADKVSFHITEEGFVWPSIRIEFKPKNSYINKTVFLDFIQTRML